MDRDSNNTFHYLDYNHSDTENPNHEGSVIGGHLRRFSFNDDFHRPVELRLDVAKTKGLILRQEDTDGDLRVTIEDQGPKHLVIRSGNHGAHCHNIRGNYMISTLLQELTLLEDQRKKVANTLKLKSARITRSFREKITLDKLTENPVTRLNRMIRNYFWPALVRKIDGDGLSIISMDPKNRSANHRPRIFIPYDDNSAWEYFQQVAILHPYLNLDVIKLPQDITPKYVQSLNSEPGILALELVQNGNHIEGKPFLVPGGRFNELYGWDSYFIILGLLEDASIENDNLSIARSIVDNLVYEIAHYGMILNANRSYYLRRSQPPFLTDMAIRVHEALISQGGKCCPTEASIWLDRVMRFAKKEYEEVWMSSPRYIAEVGLSRYCSDVQGVPPETESTHFDSLLTPYLAKYGIKDKSEFIDKYNEGLICEPILDEYFMHDRAVRESGHDTTYRLDGRAAHLCTVDLCSLLYKYEIDMANYFEGQANFEESHKWKEAALRRQKLANQLLWDENQSMYYDYDFKNAKRIDYESVTAFWPLWSGMASQEQADALVNKNLLKFEMAGGLVSGTKESLGEISLNRPNRQWDYPFGWAPHQMMAWRGLKKYGYHDIASRLAYRWCFMITKAFSDFNGVVPEKFDVVRMSHKVSAEYGNVGTEFELVPREGFGWMNASYVVGQRYLSPIQRKALGALAQPDVLFSQK